MAFRTWDDRHIEQVLAKLLRACVIVAALIVLCGGILFMVHHGGEIPQYGTFRSEPTDLRNVTGITADVLSFRSRGVIQLGLLMLMITPVTWIVFLFVGFVRQRDRLYIIVTTIVLSILIYSLAGGHFW